MSSDHQSRTSFTLFFNSNYRNKDLSKHTSFIHWAQLGYFWVPGSLDIFYLEPLTLKTLQTNDPACPPDRYSPLPCYTCSHLCCPARRRGVLDVRVSSWLVCWGSTSCPSALALSPSLPLNCSHLLVQRALFYLEHEWWCDCLLLCCL